MAKAKKDAPPAVVAPPVVAPAIEKREEAVEALFPEINSSNLWLPDSKEVSDSPVSTPPQSEAETIEPPSVGEWSAKLTSIIDLLRRELKKRIPGMNSANTKDGSQFGVNIHNTRLVRSANGLDTELKDFAEFLTREGFENGKE